MAAEEINGPNGLVFDHRGNLYFTDPLGSSAGDPKGCLHRMSTVGISLLVL